MTDPHKLQAARRLEWIRANLRPGERVEDFLPPPSKPRPPLFGTRKAKRWPLWASLLGMGAAVALWPLVTGAAVLAWVALLIGLPFWTIARAWLAPAKTEAKPWTAPRVLPPDPLVRRGRSLAEKAGDYGA